MAATGDLRSLEALGLIDDPISEPLSYPGALPTESGLLTGRRYLPLRRGGSGGAGEWIVAESTGSTTLDEALTGAGKAAVAQRHTVVAVGSNASPAQMFRKFDSRDTSVVFPLVRCTVRGIAAGVSAHINKHGYVPAAPIETPGKTSELFVLWLDDAQLEALDLTEPNYRRVALPTGMHPVTTPDGVLLQRCFIYVSRWGCLTDPEGRALRLTGQRELISKILYWLPELRKSLGRTPEEFVIRAQDEGPRTAAAKCFAEHHMIARQSGLERLERV